MKNLAAALVEAQKEMPAVTKDRVNDGFRRNGKGGEYMSLDHLIAVTRPHLAKHGLTVVQQLATSDTGAPAITTTLLHESGEALTSTMPLPLVTDMQKLGAAITYGRRYSWASLLGISDEDDDDGNSVSGAASPVAAAGRGAAGDGPAAPTKGSAAADAGGQQAAGDALAGANPPAANFQWASGKHAGKTLEETPRDYIVWYAASGPKQDAREACNAFLLGDELAEVGATEIRDGYTDPTDIPFAATIDGLGN